MNGRIVLVVLLVIVVAGALVGASAYAYNVGIAQGVAQADKLPAPSTGQLPYPYPYFGGPLFYRPWGFGLGCLGILFPLFFLFVIFGIVRAVFWNTHWRRRGWMAEGHVPPPFEEWHRHAHEKQEGHRAE